MYHQWTSCFRRICTCANDCLIMHIASLTSQSYIQQQSCDSLRDSNTLEQVTDRQGVNCMWVSLVKQRGNEPPRLTVLNRDRCTCRARGTRFANEVVIQV